VWVRYDALAADQQTSPRSGHRYIESLANQGLVAIVEKDRGRARVYVWDPREVSPGGRDRTSDSDRPLLVNLADDEPGPSVPPQVEPPIGADDESAETPIGDNADSPGGRDRTFAREKTGSGPVPRPADPPIQSAFPPIRPAPIGENADAAPLPSESKLKSSPSPSVLPSEPSKVKARRESAKTPVPSRTSAETPNRETQALAALERSQRRTAGYADDPLHAGHALGARGAELAVRLPGQTDRLHATEALLAKIRAGVNDPALRTAPALRVARAVVEGAFPERELDEILLRLRRLRTSGALRGPAWQYFVGTARKMFLRRGLAWPAGLKGCEATR
jgi:hypothetical protein